MKPMLAKAFDNQNVKGWLMSEKLDGVRAIWTGSEFVSRNGNKFFAPDWFTSQLPAGVVLDGELYTGRNDFQRCVGFVRKKTPVDSDWRMIRFCVFDAPKATGGFESRLAFCAEALAGCAVSAALEHTICQGESHLDEVFSSLVSLGAEGVMLRKPRSAYEMRRSDCLLKYKPILSDEAVVIEYQEGKGRNAGRIGALICRWRDIVFNVGAGLDDVFRERPPRKGSIISFSFQGLTDGGVPRFPSFLAVRDYE